MLSPQAPDGLPVRFRFDTVRAMPLAVLNRITGEFVTKGGKVMQGKRSTPRRLATSAATRVKRLGSHLIRHSFEQGMARAGASIAEIQDVLGHESDKMARHYAGEARKVAAANLMTKYSLAG